MDGYYIGHKDGYYIGHTCMFTIFKHGRHSTSLFELRYFDLFMSVFDTLSSTSRQFYRLTKAKLCVYRNLFGRNGF